MDEHAKALAYSISAIHIEIRILVQMLERRGVLEPGAYLKALKDTINHPEAQYERFDYEVLRQLAILIEGHHDTPKPG